MRPPKKRCPGKTSAGKLSLYHYHPKGDADQKLSLMCVTSGGKQNNPSKTSTSELGK